MSRHSTSLVVITGVISLAAGLCLGFVAGVGSTTVGQEFIADMFESEKKASTTNPKTLLRPRFEVKYPSNWKIDTADSDYSPDHMFSIESPGNAFCMFVLGEAQLGADEALKAQMDQFGKLIPNPTSSVPFDRYGTLAGKGRQLTGNVFGSPTLIKIFAHSGENGTLVVVQQVSISDSKLTTEGFQLIENSFRFRTPAETGKTKPE